MKLTIDETLQQAMAAHKEGKLQEAERLYRAILQFQPSHPDANHNLGVLAVSGNKSDAALPLFKTALKANPKKEQFWFSYIDALIKDKKFEAAKQVIEQVKTKGMAVNKLAAFESRLVATIEPSESYSAPHKEKPTFAEKRKKLAEAKKNKKKEKNPKSDSEPSDAELNKLLLVYQNKRFEEAEKLAISLTGRFPKHPFAWKILGPVLEATGRKSEAVKASQKAVELSPQDPEAHISLGNTLTKQGSLEQAEASYRRGIALRPNVPEDYHNLGNILKNQGRFDDAESCYAQAIMLKPDFALAHNNLGSMLEELGRPDEAETSFIQAISLRPDYAEAHNNLGITLKTLGRLNEAEASFIQAISLKPDYAQAHNNLGVTLQELGRQDEAEASQKHAIKLKPDDAKAHNNLGVTLFDLGRLDEAEASYTRAIDLKPEYAEAHSNLGVTLQKMRKLDEAEASYRQAIELKPENFAEIYDQLGVILQKKGEFEEAEVCYKKCMFLEPNKTPKTTSKGSILFKQGLFEKALRTFENYDDAISKAQILESMYALGRVDDVYERIKARAGLDDENLRVGAIAAFLADREKKNTAHKFCNNPIDFIHFANIESHINEPDSFIASVIDELQHVRTEWESNTTKNGFQADVDVFKNPLEKMSILKSIILDEIDTYYSKFKNESCSYIRKWPSEKRIKGWHVVLNQRGHQSSHFHPDGWLSGVIYLMVVPSLGNDEGAIEFTLDGPNYLDVTSSRKIYQPRLGDIVFFPSSLHHRTLPFSTDMKRICVSFDLMPPQ